MLVRGFIATRLISREYRNIAIGVFKIMDKFNRGIISNHEIREGFHIFFGKKISKEDTRISFENYDPEKTGYYTPAQFITASLTKEVLVSLLPWVWEILAGERDWVEIIAFKEKLANDLEEKADCEFMSKELKGPTGFGVSYEELEILVLGDYRFAA
jgi:hypothetical protein